MRILLFNLCTLWVLIQNTDIDLQVTASRGITVESSYFYEKSIYKYIILVKYFLCIASLVCTDVMEALEQILIGGSQ